MKTNLRTIILALRNFTIQSDLLGIRLNYLNSFLSVVSIKINNYKTRYLFFFSFDPASIRLELLFINFTPSYEDRLRTWAALKQQEAQDRYVQSHERAPAKEPIKPGGNVERALRNRASHK